MQNSIAAGRRLAIRVVIAQLGATALAAAASSVFGWRFGLATLCGGLIAAAGTTVLGLRLFGPGPAQAGVVLARLIVGSVLKWGIIAVGLYLAMVKAGLPGPAVLAGLIAALIPQLLGLHEGWAPHR